MNNRINRLAVLSKIPAFARIDHRIFLNRSGDLPLFEGMSRKERRKIQVGAKKTAVQYGKIVNDLCASGVGFPVDQTLRQMAIEYTHRFASSGTNTMPVSFNYFEPFCTIKLIDESFAPYAQILSEENHLFYASDFFDFLTSNDSNGFRVESIMNIPDSKILHFSNSGDIESLSFFDSCSREYVISGFSLIRRGSSLYWFLLAGELLSKEEWDVRQNDCKEIILENLDPWKKAFLEECIKRSGGTTGVLTKLEGCETAVKTLVTGEFDILTNKHLERAIFIESENSFFVFCDDPEILSAIFSEEKKEKIINNSMERISEASIPWNMAEGFFQLPQYFETCLTVPENLVQEKSKKAGLRGRGGMGSKAKYISIPAIYIDKSNAPPIIRQVSLPAYRIETEGHWKRLGLNEQGNDRIGNVVLGKTWVKKHSPWRDERPKESVVYVKDCLATAKRQVDSLYKDTMQGKRVENLECGQLYVLRCSLMQEEVYKVGWTSGTATERAMQLSAETGVPMAYIVMESWTHPNPKALEVDVHAQLSPYRVNSRREFFRLNFKSIRKIIIQVIDRNQQF